MPEPRQRVGSGPIQADGLRAGSFQKRDRRRGGSIGGGVRHHGLDRVSHGVRLADPVQLGLVDAARPQVHVALDAVEHPRQRLRVGARAVGRGQVVAGGRVAEREPAALEVPLEPQQPPVLGTQFEHHAVARVRPRPVPVDGERLVAQAAPPGGEAEEPRPQRRVGRALARFVRSGDERQAGPEPQLGVRQLPECGHAQAVNPHR